MVTCKLETHTGRFAAQLFYSLISLLCSTFIDSVLMKELNSRGELIWRYHDDSQSYRLRRITEKILLVEVVDAEFIFEGRVNSL